MTLRVYVSGQRSFGAAAADLTVRLGHTLTGAASPPDRDGQPDPLRAAAFRHRTPWTDSTRLRPDDIPLGTDVLLAAHSHAFLGRRSRARAHLAAIGYHPSLLPLHRGRDAVRWTIRDRDRVTGGSVYHLTDTVDAGPLAAQDYLLVPPGSTASALWRDHLFPLGLTLLERVLTDLDNGVIVRVPQDEVCATWEPSWDRPRLHRPELPELPPPGDSGVRYRVDRSALRTT
ncbi:formyltransferase family protein [Streptomyces sp. AD55]|uniref:formyltransferase family protein n=1 Tax=Streptomyces sp. AD55 TaxID=3242895 RepID=UPI003528A654